MWSEIIHLLKIIQGKWVFHILFVLLEHEKIHFNGLKKNVNPISSRILSLHLKQLTQLGLVIKNIIVDKPLRVEYKLTMKGKTFLSTIIDTFTNTQIENVEFIPKRSNG